MHKKKNIHSLFFFSLLLFLLLVMEKTLVTFRAPIVAWTTFPDKKKNRQIVYPALEKLQQCISNYGAQRLDKKIANIQVVEDMDTDSTPMRVRSRYRRIARRKLFYANVQFVRSTTTEKEAYASLENVFEKFVFVGSDFKFKLFPDELSCQDFFKLY